VILWLGRTVVAGPFTLNACEQRSIEVPVVYQSKGVRRRALRLRANAATGGFATRTGEVEVTVLAPVVNRMKPASVPVRKRSSISPIVAPSPPQNSAETSYVRVSPSRSADWVSPLITALVTGVVATLMAFSLAQQVIPSYSQPKHVPQWLTTLPQRLATWPRWVMWASGVLVLLHLLNKGFGVLPSYTGPVFSRKGGEVFGYGLVGAIYGLVVGMIWSYSFSRVLATGSLVWAVTISVAAVECGLLVRVLDDEL
jgi:hypothetical protein